MTAALLALEGLGYAGIVLGLFLLVVTGRRP